MSPWTKDLLEYLEDREAEKAEQAAAAAHDATHASCDPVECAEAAYLAVESDREDAAREAYYLAKIEERRGR